MKVLNLYAGIGGNRKLWDGVKIHAVEIDRDVAEVYHKLYPRDRVFIHDAHEYLLKYFNEYDFIWSSPPCQSHSQFRYRCGHKAWNQKPLYPDMKLYEEIILLQHYFKGKWVVENTESYYKPLIKPQKIARHYFWSNFYITDFNSMPLNIKIYTKEDYYKMHGIDLSRFDIHNKRTLMRNCVYPPLGKHIFDCAFKIKQENLVVR